MPEETTPAAVAQDQNTVTPPAGAQNTETPTEAMIPIARFNEVNNRLKALEKEQATRSKEQQAEDEKKLAAQAAWQELADKRKAALEELTPKVELADKLTELVTAQYANEVKAWPEQIRNMAPAEDATILAKLDWMAKAKPLALELMADKSPVAGNGRRPTPTATVGKTPAKVEPITDVRKNF